MQPGPSNICFMRPQSNDVFSFRLADQEMGLSTVAGIGTTVLICVAALVLWLKGRRAKSMEEIEAELRKKFTACDGITLYDNGSSPCAKRVRITLKEKGIKHHVVLVNLSTRENRHPFYLAINPQGKVPAMVVRNIEGIPDCCLYESNAITEWLDEQFPWTTQLYPLDPWERAQVKLWQRWEGAMAEDFWPLMYANVLGPVNRFLYSRDTYKNIFSNEKDPYQFAKMMKTYDGELLSPREMKRNAIHLYKWLNILESALENKTYICGNTFTTADISVIPRTLMYPITGLLETKEEQNRYPNVMRYLRNVGSRPSFHEPSVVSLNLVRWLPWSLIERVGNWRSGMVHHRIHGRDALKELDKSEEPALSTPISIPEGTDVVLYCHAPWPDSISVKIGCAELNLKVLTKEVDMVRLEHKAGSYLALNPLGEVPTAIHADHVIYDAQNIMEYLDSLYSDDIHQSLLPMLAIDRVQVRMWQGWCRTCFNYQLIHLYKQYILLPILQAKFSSREKLLTSLHKSTTATDHTDDLVHLFEQKKGSPEETESKMSPYKSGLRKCLEYLDGKLEGHSFLVTTKLTMADISVFSLLLLFKWVQIDINLDYPNVTAWRERLLARPGFFFGQAAVDEYMLRHGIHQLP